MLKHAVLLVLLITVLAGCGTMTDVEYECRADGTERTQEGAPVRLRDCQIDED